MTIDETISWIDVYSKNTTSDSMPVEALQIIAGLKAAEQMDRELTPGAAAIRVDGLTVGQRALDEATDAP